MNNHMEIPWHEYTNKDSKVKIENASLTEKSSIIGRIGLMLLACGTGACAAAVVAIAQGKVESPVSVYLPGGKLSISWEGGKSPVFMSGPAQRVYEGTILI